MRSLWLLFFLISFSLHCQSTLSFQNGVSFPDGLISGFAYTGQEFRTQTQIAYKENSVRLRRFNFISDFFSIGSVSSSGILRDLKSENLHYFSFTETAGATIDRDGSPQNNFGIIFHIDQFDSGCSVSRSAEMSQLLVWKNFNFSDSGFMTFGQSLSFKEEAHEIESWYLDHPDIRSESLSNSLISVIWGKEEMFGGCELLFNASQWDSPGYSIQFLGGISHRYLYFQNELRYNSPGFISSDMKPGKYTWLMKGQLNFLNLSISLDNSYYFALYRETLPWENRLWKFHMETDGVWEIKNWSLLGNLAFSFFNSETDQFEASVLLGGSLRKEYRNFYWQISGDAAYDSIYIYRIKLKGGYLKPFIDLNLTTSFVIDRRISMELSFKGKWQVGNPGILTELSFENIGLYNCPEMEIKPYFFMGLEW